MHFINHVSHSLIWPWRGFWPAKICQNTNEKKVFYYCVQIVWNENFRNSFSYLCCTSFSKVL